MDQFNGIISSINHFSSTIYEKSLHCFISSFVRSLCQQALTAVSVLNAGDKEKKRHSASTQKASSLLSKYSKSGLIGPRVLWPVATIDTEGLGFISYFLS